MRENIKEILTNSPMSNYSFPLEVRSTDRNAFVLFYEERKKKYRSINEIFLKNARNLRKENRIAYKTRNLFKSPI